MRRREAPSGAMRCGGACGGDPLGMNFCQGAFGAIDTMLNPNASRDSSACPERIKGFFCLFQMHQGIPVRIPSASKEAYAYPKLIKGKAAKVSKGRPQTPLVASAEAKPSDTYIEKVIRTEQHGMQFTSRCSCGVKATPTCTFRLGEKYQKPTGAANSCMREWPPRTPRILIACARIAGAPR